MPHQMASNPVNGNSRDWLAAWLAGRVISSPSTVAPAACTSGVPAGTCTAGAWAGDPTASPAAGLDPPGAETGPGVERAVSAPVTSLLVPALGAPLAGPAG